jgi:membrane protein implicated in regulation of membrane protease activity
MKGVVSGSHKLILGFFLLIALLFLSVALAIYLGEYLDSIALGYLIVGGCYLILMFILSLFLKKFLEKKILNKASAQFFNENEVIKIDKYESLQ